MPSSLLKYATPSQLNTTGRDRVRTAGGAVDVRVDGQFESVEALAAVGRADLRAVGRVGKNRARAIRQRARRECEW